MELLAGTILFLKLLPFLFTSVIIVKGFIGSGEQTTEDLLRHSYNIGETGTGKSTKCLNDIIKAINLGFGLLYIDVHGKDSRELLDYIPPEHIDRVIYINPADMDYVIGFPLFDVGDDELAVDAVVSVFHTLWPAFIGPSTEDIIRMSSMAVLPQKGTLLEIYKMLVDEDYRKHVIDNIEDAEVKEYWGKTFEQVKKDKSRLNPPTNKLRKLIMSKVCRYSLCQSRPKFDLFKEMKNNSIIICNFSKGALGHDTSSLMAALMFSKLWLCAFMRSEKDVPFMCFLDEFQNYVTSNFEDILSEARKYRVGLNLYHQYMKQVPPDLYNAIRGNVGSRYAFRGDGDAKTVAEMFDIDVDEIKNLENFTCWSKELINGKREKEAKLIKCPPPPPKHGCADYIISRSKQYGYRPDYIADDIAARFNLKQPDTMEDVID